MGGKIPPHSKHNIFYTNALYNSGEISVDPNKKNVL